MTALVVGGAASGKSAYAESLACALHAPRGADAGAAAGRAPGRLFYIATLLARDAESRARVERHRAARAHRGFTTLECPLALGRAALPPGCTALVEDLPNLVANELYEPGGAGEEAYGRVCAAIGRLCARARNLVLVSGDLFADGGNYGPSTARYLALLGEVNQYAASLAQVVTEVVCGIPLPRKGAPLEL